MTALPAFADPFRTILVVSSRADFLDPLRVDPLVSQYPLVIIPDAKNAQSFLADRDNALLGVFVDPESALPNGLSVVRAAHHHRPGLRCFLVARPGFDLGLSPQELRAIGVHEILRTPLLFKDMVTRLSPLSIEFDALAEIEKARLNSDILDEETTKDAQTFVSISAKDFLSGSTSFFDVYVKLGSQKFVKLLQAGDAFTAERLTSYLKKGVTHFYILKQAQEAYIAYCDKLTSSLLKKSAGPVDIQISQTLNQGEQTLNFLKRQGVSENSLLHAQNFISNVRSLIQSEKIDLNESFQALVKNVALYDHSVGTTMLTSMLADTLEISMERPVQIVGMTGMLHDIALAQLPEVVVSEDITKMSADELKLYYEHPKMSADILSRIKGTHPTVIQAVLQHHMRPHNTTGLSFPAREFGRSLNKVGEMVGICGDFQRWIERSEEATRKGEPFNLLKELEYSVFPDFSRQIVYAFRSAFFPRRPPPSPSAS